MLGGRSLEMVKRSALEWRQYAALVKMARLYPAAPRMLKRYFLGGGSYPYTCRVRTPTGTAEATLYSHHDVWTVNEVFCREDYRAGPEVRTVVDVGSNIGISALYFLTRGELAHCYLYEPVPRNVERLRLNLRRYEHRFELREIAVADRDGQADFAVEPTGRYGGLDAPGTSRIRVVCRRISAVLDDVLQGEEGIDVLKLDTEGSERATVAAIEERQLARIGTILYETSEPWNPDPERFAMSFACETCRLDNRAPQRLMPTRARGGSSPRSAPRSAPS
jgi:FkbM family methyltransferase